MNLDVEMEKAKGPFAVLQPDEGQCFALAGQPITAQIKMVPGDYPHFKFTAIRYDLQPGARFELHATLLAPRILQCLEGAGRIELNGEAKPFFEEVFVHLGEGHHGTVVNEGGGLLSLFVFTFGASPDGRPDLMTRSADGALTLSIDEGVKRLYGLLDLDDALALPAAKRGELIHQLPDTGISFWQAVPTAGWVEVKMAPFTCNVHHYAVLMQTLYEGSRVREHAHNQLNEFLVITKGVATASVDGCEDVICPKGSVIIAGRNIFHRWANGGTGITQNFGIIDPPGVEGGLAFTGRLREKGTEWPSDIVRNAETGKLMHERFGFVIHGSAADARVPTKG